jgi:hypothetical protein
VKDTLYFNDGTHRVDMMLVFEDDLDFMKEQRRKTFLRNLVDEGAEIEIEHPDPTRRRVCLTIDFCLLDSFIRDN